MNPILVLRALLKLSTVSIASDELVLICPAGIGDTYFVCGLAAEIAKKNNMKISVLVRTSHRMIAQAFATNLHRIILFPPHLIKFTKLAGLSFSPGRFFYAHPSQLFFPRRIRFIGHKITLLDSYQILFELPETATLSKPVFLDKSSRAKNIRQKKKKKMAFISPETTSTDQLSPDFWQAVFNKLDLLGYQLCINSNRPEYTFKNENYFVDLQEIPAIVEECDIFIASRSGICDLVSTCKTKKIILFPNQPWYDGTVFSASSFAEMHFGYNIHELVFSTPARTLQRLIRIVKTI